MRNIFIFSERGQGLDRPAMGMRYPVWIHPICVVRCSHYAASYCLGHCNLSIEEKSCRSIFLLQNINHVDE